MEKSDKNKHDWVSNGGFAEITMYRCKKCNSEITDCDGDMSYKDESVYKGPCPPLQCVKENEILEFAQSKWGKKTPERIALKLSEECGEVAGAVIKMGEKRATRSDLLDEIGDCLIVLSQLAALYEESLEFLRERRFREIKRR